jgi:hypothetical protein
MGKGPGSDRARGKAGDARGGCRGYGSSRVVPRVSPTYSDFRFSILAIGD